MGYLLASWCVIVPFLAYLSYDYFAQGDWQSGVMLALSALLMTQLHRITITPQQTEQARQLAQTEEVTAIGPLAEALEWPDLPSRTAAAQALTRLLPLLTPDKEALLDAVQRDCLRRMLTPATAQSDPSLVIAILKALAQIGDEAALSSVQRLAENASVSPRVRFEARECLALLRQRSEEARNRNSLLRPSIAASTPADMLLRAASANPAGTAPEQLLRPGDAPNDALH